MLAPNRLQQIDQLLNELEGLARSDMPSQKYWRLLLERLQLTIGAGGAELLIPLGSPSDNTVCLASVGTQPSELRSVFLSSLNHGGQSNHLVGQLDSIQWLAVPVRPGQYHCGCLLVSLKGTTSVEQTTALIDLLHAFAEIAGMRQLADVERLFGQRWHIMEEVCRQLPASTHVAQARTILVNQLARLLGAARVGLVGRTFLDGWQLLAISGITSIDRSLTPIQQLQRDATEAARLAKCLSFTAAAQASSDIETKLTSSPALDASGLFQNRLIVPLESDPVSKRWQHQVTIEWATTDAMLSALPAVSLALPVLSASWHQQAQWLSMPVWLRSIRLGPNRWPRLLRRSIGWLLVLSILFAAYRTLISPQTLMIEAPAVLEPQVKRSLFAPADGYVDQLHVSDGQLVHSGQLVAGLRSPALELQIEELQGDLRAVLEKHSALRVAINQVDPAARDALLSQSRLSAEVAELTVREKNLRAQLEFLQAEKDKLQLVSPIDGLVATRQLEQQLTGRPVRRGDALLTILDLNGPWQLRLRVADRDSGYVRRKLAGTASDARQLEFVLDSLPERRFTGEVQWVSDVVQNDQGCFVEMHAQVDRQVVDQSRMGAGAAAWFDCGQQPLWFVWCRPLVEAAQRKLWLDQPEGSNHAREE